MNIIRSGIFIGKKTGVLLFYLLIALSFCSTAVAQKVYPPLQRIIKPEPAPPTPGAVFAPLMEGGVLTAAPAIAEWTRSAGPDESVVMTGINFSNYKDSNQGRDARFALFDGTAFHSPSIQRVENDKAIITLDSGIRRSMYLIWPGNEAGYGYPVAINKTDAWWVGPSSATKEESISVYGRNLSLDHTTSNVYLKASDGTGQWAEVKSVNPYRVEFQLPSALDTGLYEVWVHNGQGGDYGWSGPLELWIVPSAQWSNVVFNVKDYGAAGDSSTDDTEAIRRALEAAGQEQGATLYFPAGVYLISNTLSPGSHTRWRGEGHDYSIIRCAENFSASASGMLLGTVTKFQISNIGFEGNRNFRGTLDKPIFLRGSRAVRFDSIRFDFQGYQILDLHWSRHIFLQGCTLVGAGSFLGNCSQLFIDRCEFRLTNDAELALLSWGGTGISLTRSTCMDHDNSNSDHGGGWGKGRFFVGSGVWGSNRFTYLAENVTSDLTVRPYGADQNAGEQILWEGNASVWSGPVASSTPLVTVLHDFALSTQNTLYAVIVKGKGLGQARLVVAFGRSEIRLEEPWNVTPDSSSIIHIGPYTDRVVVYNNYLDGKARAVSSPDHIASAGIQLYGGVFNLVADRNTLHEVRQGIANWATQHSVGFEPSYFNLFTDNQLVNCRVGINNVSFVYKQNRAEVQLGNQYRHNSIYQTVVAAILNEGASTPDPLLNATVYEHNILQDIPAGFLARSTAMENQVFYANRFNRGTAPVLNTAIEIIPKVVLRKNAYQDFATNYLGEGSGSIMEAPNHVLELIRKSGDPPLDTFFTLWNSGPQPLNWVAYSGAAWLNLTSDSGTIADEGSVGLIGLRVNSDTLPVGLHTTALIVSASGQTRVYTVELSISHPPVSPPEISITNPAENAVFITPAYINLNVYSADTNRLEKIEFFANGRRLGEDINEPYEFYWDNVAAGCYTLTARSTTQSGLTITSQPVQICVKQPEWVNKRGTNDNFKVISIYPRLFSGKLKTESFSFR